MSPADKPGSLSLVIPAYNEESRLGDFLRRTRSYLEQSFGGSFEILVVDDGSTDRTAQLVRETLGPSNLVSLPTNMGKGYAVKTGMLAARGELRLFLDADGSTPIEDESKLRRVIEMGSADIAIGSRSIGGGCRRFKGPFSGIPGTHPNNGPGGVTWLVKPHRHFMGRLFSLAVNGLMGFSYADTQCGAKMFTPGAAEAIFSRLTTNRFAFDVEVLYLARRLGYRVEEVAVNWQDIGDSNVSLLTDPVAMLFDILKVRHRHRNVTA